MTQTMAFLIPVLILGATLPASAQPPKQAALQPIGTFADWRGYTRQDAAGRLCYAYTNEMPQEDKPGHETPHETALNAAQNGPTDGGKDADPAVLFVTHLPGRRNSVAIMPGFTYPNDAHVLFEVDGAALPFLTKGNSAFARDDAAAIEALKAGRLAEVEAPRENGTAEMDRFSLIGFTAAYDAISAACPAK